jgi:Arc/MetJ-type ribon-helix-helix transcriptional regulator
MSLAEIKSAVRELSPKELAELAKFIAEQDNAAWDKEMEADAASGKLDFLFEEADRERAAGQLRDWPDEK